MRNKVILCPNKDKPGVHEAAEVAYKEWMARGKKHRFKKCKDKLFSYDKLSDKEKAKMQESVLACLCLGALMGKASTITTDSPTKTRPLPTSNPR